MPEWWEGKRKNRFRYYSDVLSRCNGLGYKTLTDAIRCEYRRLKSSKKVGEVVGLSHVCVLDQLHGMGETVMGRGGPNNKKYNYDYKEMSEFYKKTGSIGLVMDRFGCCQATAYKATSEVRCQKK